MKKSQTIQAFCVNGDTEITKGKLSKRFSGSLLRRRFSGVLIASFLLVLSFRGTAQSNFVSDISNSGEADSACISSWSENGLMSYVWGNCSSDHLTEFSILSNSYRTIKRDEGSSSQGIPGISLPAEMLLFYGSSEEETIELFWTTATEVGNERFDIYHSMDLDNFQLMASMPAVGDAQAESNYHFNHDNAEQGVHYYQLIQVDIDGDEKASGVVSVSYDKPQGETCFSNVYPNPVNDQCHFRYNGTDFLSVLTISLHSLKGEKVYSSQVAGINNIDGISIPTNLLTNGIYIITIEQDGTSEKQKLKVMH